MPPDSPSMMMFHLGRQTADVIAQARHGLALAQRVAEMHEDAIREREQLRGALEALTEALTANTGVHQPPPPLDEPTEEASIVTPSPLVTPLAPSPTSLEVCRAILGDLKALPAPTQAVLGGAFTLLCAAVLVLALSWRGYSYRNGEHTIGPTTEQVERTKASGGAGSGGSEMPTPQP